VVEAVKALPEPLACVFHPVKAYPLRTGLAGKSVTVVAGDVTVLTAWTASAPASVPLFSAKVTVYPPGSGPAGSVSKGLVHAVKYRVKNDKESNRNVPGKRTLHFLSIKNSFAF
jgi:hypothetical protein